MLSNKYIRAHEQRPRVLHSLGRVQPQLPAAVEINFWLQPEQSFGMSAEDGTATTPPGFRRYIRQSISMALAPGKVSALRNYKLAGFSVERLMNLRRRWTRTSRSSFGGNLVHKRLAG